MSVSGGCDVANEVNQMLDKSVRIIAVLPNNRHVKGVVVVFVNEFKVIVHQLLRSFDVQLSSKDKLHQIPEKNC